MQSNFTLIMSVEQLLILAPSRQRMRIKIGFSWEKLCAECYTLELFFAELYRLESKRNKERNSSRRGVQKSNKTVIDCKIR